MLINSAQFLIHMSFPIPTMSETSANIERARWSTVSKDLVGRVVQSIEELKTLFPEDEQYGIIVESENSIREDAPKVLLAGRMRRMLDAGFRTYSRPMKRPYSSAPIDSRADVAYQCGSCERVVVGSPNITTTSFPKHGPGRQDVNYNCIAPDCQASLKVQNLGRKCF